jgi:hypothetical protein
MTGADVWLLLKFMAGVGLLGALVVGVVSKFVTSGRVIKYSEVAALRSVTKEANTRIGTDDPRKRPLRVMTQRFLTYDTTLPVLLVPPEELAVLAPFIDDRLRRGLAQGLESRAENSALEAFKQRMVRQGIWPHSSPQEMGTDPAASGSS